MEFRLFYRGPLKAKGKPKDKHTIRCELHRQLKVLCEQPPLKDDKRSIENYSHAIDNYRFVPLLSVRNEVICELDILILRKEPAGKLISQGGDLDNRLKTLFDALRMPQDSDEVPKKNNATAEPDPFYCVLENDVQIVSFKVTSDTLLEAGDDSEVVLIIGVRPRVTRRTIANEVFS